MNADPSTRKNTRARAIILAGALALATVSFAAPAPAQSSAGLASGMQAGLGQLDKKLDAVGATPDQKTKIKAILFDAFSSMGPVSASVKPTLHAMSAALLAPAVDRAGLERARVMAVGNFDAVSRVLFKALGDAAEVLTPEQRAKLAAGAKKNPS